MATILPIPRRGSVASIALGNHARLLDVDPGVRDRFDRSLRPRSASSTSLERSAWPRISRISSTSRATLGRPSRAPTTSPGTRRGTREKILYLSGAALVRHNECSTKRPHNSSCVKVRFVLAIASSPATWALLRSYRCTTGTTPRRGWRCCSRRQASIPLRRPWSCSRPQRSRRWRGSPSATHCPTSSSSTRNGPVASARGASASRASGTTTGPSPIKRRTPRSAA